VKSKPLGVCCTWLVLVAACNAKPKPTPPAGAASGSAAPRVSATTPAERVTEAPETACRALLMNGDIQLGDAKLRPNSLLRGRAWLSLAKGAELVAKHTASGREFTVTGPARAIVCPDGEEQVVLANGALRTTAGPGVRPGALVLVATPAGVIHYGDADLKAQVSRQQVDIQVYAGGAWVQPTFGSKRIGPDQVTAGAGKSGLRTRPGLSATHAITACRESASTAAFAAEAVLKPGAAQGSLGERAAAQLRARAEARALCASALAWLGEAHDPAETERLSGSIAESEQLFRVVPRLPDQPGK
jgi:hypothetical protein